MNMLANQYIIAKLNNIETGAILDEFWNRGIMTAQGPWTDDYLVRKGLLRQESIDYANVLKKNEDYQETLMELNMREHDLARGIMYDAQEDYMKGSTCEELMPKYEISQYHIDDLISAFNEEDEHERYELLDEWALNFIGLDDNWHCMHTLTACLFEEYTDILNAKSERIQKQMDTYYNYSTYARINELLFYNAEHAPVVSFEVKDTINAALKLFNVPRGTNERDSFIGYFE